MPGTLPIQPPPHRRPPTRRAAADKVTFSFEDAQWGAVFEWLAGITGKALVKEDTPEGTFNYFDTKEYTVPEALDVINSVLLDKKFVCLIHENFLIVLNVDEGFPPHLVDQVSIEELPKRGRTEPVKVLIPLEGMVADQAKKEFEQIKGPYGAVYPLASTNNLLVVDTARNVQAIVDLIQSLRVDKGGIATLKAFPLQYVSALDAERVVREILGLPSRESAAAASSSRGTSRSTSSDPRERMRQMFMERFGGGDRSRSGRPSMGGPPQSSNRTSSRTSSQQQTQATESAYVSVDERTNTLFVTAKPDKLALVENVVKSLDIPEAAGSAGEGRQTPKFSVYPVEAGTAAGLVKALDELFERSPETRIAAHPSDRALLVYATPREHERIGELLEQFQSEGLKVEVIQLSVLDAVSTASLIKKVLGQQDDQSNQRLPFFLRSRSSSTTKEDETGPAVEADATQNQLIVRGTEDQIVMVRELLSKMGERGVLASGKGLGPSRYRVIPLGQADPVQVMDQVQRAWKEINPTTPLQIQVLGAPAHSVPEPKGDQPHPPAKKKSSEPNDKPKAAKTVGAVYYPAQSEGGYLQMALWTSPEPSNSGFTFVADQTPAPAAPKARVPELRLPAETKADPKAGPEPSKPSEPKPIHVILGSDGNLAVFSEDPKNAELFETLVRSIVGPAGASSGYAVYYLKAADAQEMATMLDTLLYGQRGLFDSGADSAVEARILPDTRTNSLIVVGPGSEHRKIVQLLEELDREDIPETGVIAEPRTIPLRYASASAVVSVVKEVFAPYLYTGQNQQNQQQQQTPGFPFAMMMGRRGSSSGGSRNNQDRATVSVDPLSNALIVSAPKPLFERIEEVVHMLDEAAKDRTQSTRVVTLKNAAPDAVEKALGTLFGVTTEQSADAQRRSTEAASRFRNRSGNQTGDPRAGGFQNFGGGPRGFGRPSGSGGFGGRQRSRGGFTPFRR